MRKFVVAFLIVQMVILQGCEPNTNKSTDISEYSHWTSSMKAILLEEFKNTLPKTEIVQEYGKNYYCQRRQSVLGDENFVIHVVLQFLDRNRFEEELSKYTTSKEASMLQAGNIEYYQIQGSIEEVTEYLNDEILDGMFYNFEIVSANSDKYTLTFTTARVWDYYRDEFLVEYLKNIYL